MPAKKPVPTDAPTHTCISEPYHITYRKGVTVRTADFENVRYDLEVKVALKDKPTNEDIDSLMGFVDQKIEECEEQARAQAASSKKPASGNNSLDLLM